MGERVGVHEPALVEERSEVPQGAAHAVVRRRGTGMASFYEGIGLRTEVPV